MWTAVGGQQPFSASTAHSIAAIMPFFRHKTAVAFAILRQIRWKSRSVAPLCPACIAAFAAGHHGCSLACQAPIWFACSRHITSIGFA